jgi:hypothetical protein
MWAVAVDDPELLTLSISSLSFACKRMDLTAIAWSPIRPRYTSDKALHENAVVEYRATVSSRTMQVEGSRPEVRHHLRSS